MLADYVSDVSPMIPPLVVHCISEIEQRGLHEVSVVLMCTNVEVGKASYTSSYLFNVFSTESCN